MTIALTREVSFEEYMTMDGGESNAEWVRGGLVEMSPVSGLHQEVAAFLHALLRLHVRKHHLGTVRYERFVMRLPTIPSAREPDILFVSAVNGDRLRETFVDGPADLVVEVVSLESRDRDRGAKFYEYEQGGVPEYWLIDPDRQVSEFYVLGPRGHYELIPVAADGYFRSGVVPGFRIDPAWLYENPLPDELDTLTLASQTPENG